MNDGDQCRKCGAIVKQQQHPYGWKPKATQTYWFKWWFRCIRCETLYMVNEAKRTMTQGEDVKSKKTQKVEAKDPNADEIVVRDDILARKTPENVEGWAKADQARVKAGTTRQRVLDEIRAKSWTGEAVAEMFANLRDYDMAGTRIQNAAEDVARHWLTMEREGRASRSERAAAVASIYVVLEYAGLDTDKLDRALNRSVAAHAAMHARVKKDQLASREDYDLWQAENRMRARHQDYDTHRVAILDFCVANHGLSLDEGYAAVTKRSN